MLSYITGSGGFTGSYLKDKVNGIGIPHGEIETYKLKPFDYFYFLSTYGNLHSHSNEDMIFKANIEDLLSVLKRIKNIRYKSFLFVSSSSCGRKIQTQYSRCKRAAEEILLALIERNGLPITIVRPFSITGVGDQEEHLIPTLIRSAYNGETVNFVPNAYHDWINVEDVVEAMVNLSRNHAKGIFQVGTGIQYSNQQVFDMVEEESGKKIKVNVVSNMRDYDSEEWVSTNFKARSYGWLPKKTLRQTIKEMVKAYEKSK